MHLGQSASEVLKIMQRKHSEIKFHQNWPLNSIDVTFPCGKKKGRFLMNYFQARPRAGGASEAASERADVDRLEQRALTELSIFSGPRSREVPKAEQRQESKAVPPRRAGTAQPMPEVLSQTTRRAQGWNNPARREQRALAAFIQASMLLILHFSVLPNGFALLK